MGFLASFHSISESSKLYDVWMKTHQLLSKNIWQPGTRQVT